MKPFLFEAHNGGPPREMSAQDVANDCVDESVATRVTVKLHELGLIDNKSFLDIVRPTASYGTIRARNEYDR